MHAMLLENIQLAFMNVVKFRGLSDLSALCDFTARIAVGRHAAALHADACPQHSSNVHVLPSPLPCHCLPQAVVASSGLQIVGAVFLLHSTGFFLGYSLSKALGLSDKIARTNR